MKIKNIRLGFLIVAACISSQAAGYAEIVRGEVSAVNADADFLLVNAEGRLTYAKQPERIQFRDQPDTVYEGILGLDDIRAGDKVVVEAVEDKRGPWAAKKISVRRAALPAETSSTMNSVNEGSGL